MTTPPSPGALARTQYFTACSLDGFLADADDALDRLPDPDDPAPITMRISSHGLPAPCRVPGYAASSGDPHPHPWT
jgi:hypothetical protein